MMNKDELFKKFRYPSESDIKFKDKDDIKNIYKDFQSEQKDYNGDCHYFNLGVREKYNPNFKLAGVNPVKPIYETETKHLNKEMNNILNSKEHKEDYYNNIIGNSKNEIDQMNRINKRDHIKEIFSTLNFNRKPTLYSESYEYTTEKKNDTIDQKHEYHYQKSFMKTYEENKHMHKIILRK